MPRVNPGSQFPTLTLSDIYSRLHRARTLVREYLQTA